MPSTKWILLGEAPPTSCEDRMDREVIDSSVVRVVLLHGPRDDQYDSQGKNCLIKVSHLMT